jgi:hypothetical protein
VASSALGVMFGILVGLRHAFEPDHLTAVSTLVGNTHGLRSGAMLGALWGLGHTISLVAIGVTLTLIGATLPERASVVFELGVAAMLLVLGVRAIVIAVRVGAAHDHGHGHGHRHPPTDHVHVGPRTLAWRPLLVGLVHGLAGSGALTAIVFAELPGTAARILYMVLFGVGSIGGMALASGLAGATLHAVAHSGRTRRGMGLVTGVLSIVIGILWTIPLWSRLG